LLSNKNIDHGKCFDWGRTSPEYAKFRDIYPDEFYEKIVGLGLCTRGQKVLDLGTGTGVIPRNMYKYGAEWTGTDISENQVNEAIRLGKESNMNIKFFAAPAEGTNLENNYFDVITACQCFMYFDKSKVLPEIFRMLKSGGRLLILFMAWLPYESDIAMTSEKLVLKYNPNWTGGGIIRYQSKEPEWSRELFNCVNCINYDVGVTFTRESWHGRMIACRGVGASSLSSNEIEQFKTEHWAFMQTLPEKFIIPHYVTVLDFKAKK
jgi:Methylase involved in ubiquinone/menaquinone biosynthesis